MPRKSCTPSLRRHSRWNLGVVTLNGKDHYLGSWPTGQEIPPAEVSSAYHRLIGEWEARGRRPAEESAGTTKGKEPSASDLTIHQVVLAFWKHAEIYYRRPDGTHTNELHEFRLSFRPLKALYGSLPACEFSPLKLKAVREHMIKGDLCRTLINKRISRIVRLFVWALSEELIQASVLVALKTVKGLEEGRSHARESEPVGPVEDADVNKTLPFLPRIVRAMVEVQRFTGARPGEVCSMKPGSIDRTGHIWHYRPASHKTRHKGKDRTIAIGPKAQKVLQPFLEGRAADAFCSLHGRRWRSTGLLCERNARARFSHPSNIGGYPVRRRSPESSIGSRPIAGPSLRHASRRAFRIGTLTNCGTRLLPKPGSRTAWKEPRSPSATQPPP